MAVIKMSPNRKNPQFTKSTFLIHMPNMEAFIDTKVGARVFKEYKDIASSKVFKSVWGAEWNYGMSLCISHYLVLYARNAKSTRSMGDTLSAVASMGNADGLITSMSVGEVSKSFDHSYTMLEQGADSAFWNQTGYGRLFYSMLSQKRPFAIGVVI